MAREYATQMEAARKGIITEELKSVAKKERMSVEELLPLVAEERSLSVRTKIISALTCRESVPCFPQRSM